MKNAIPTSYREKVSAHKLRLSLNGVAAVLTVLTVATACSSSSKPAGGGSSTSASASSSTSMPMPASGAASATTGASSAAGATTIDIKNFSFSPMDTTVAVGATVTWKFEDSTAHTVKANDGSFTSPAMKDGQTFSYTFTKAGSFPYICSIHQYMTGTITVK